MLDFLTNPLSQEFMRRALLEIGLISVASGALGCWVIFYGVSYAAESLSHALFPGLVVAALAGLPILVGGIPGIAVAAIAIALVGRVPGDRQRDAAVAVVVTAFFGLGALLALSPSSPPGIQTLLFGDILAPSNSDLVISAILAAGVLLSTVALHLAAAHRRLRPDDSEVAGHITGDRRRRGPDSPRSGCPRRGPGPRDAACRGGHRRACQPLPGSLPTVSAR